MIRVLNFSFTRRINSTVGVSAGSSRLNAVRFRLDPGCSRASARQAGPLEPAGLFEQQRRRRLTFGEQIGDRAHVLVGIDRLAHAHQLTDAVHPLEPFAEILDRPCRCRRARLHGCRNGVRVDMFLSLPTRPGLASPRLRCHGQGVFQRPRFLEKSLACALQHDTPADQHDRLVSQAQRQACVLLTTTIDRPWRRSSRKVPASISTRFGASPSNGSSSRRIVGLSASARAMLSICCSPPDSWFPKLPRRSASDGNSSKILSSVHVPGTRTDREVFKNGQRREDVALLRHVAHAEARPLPGRRGSDLPVVKPHLPMMPVRVAGDRAHQRGLAHAVASKHGQRGSAAQRETDVLDDHSRAVAGGDVREPEDRQAWPDSPR